MPLYRPSQSPDDRPNRLSARAAQEIAREVLRLQRSIPISLDRGRRGDFGPFGQQYTANYPGLIPAVVTTAIPACSTSSTPAPGQGAAQLWYWNDDTTTMVQNGDDGMNGAVNGIVTVLNWYQKSGTIAVGAHILIAYFANAWWLVGADC